MLLLVVIGMLTLLLITKNDLIWSCQNVCDALSNLLDIFIRFDTKLHRQIVGIPMDTYSAHLVANFFRFVTKEIL